MARRYLTAVLTEAGKIETTYGLIGEEAARAQMLLDADDHDVKVAFVVDCEAGEIIAQTPESI